jgi:hypothetical protein
MVMAILLALLHRKRTGEGQWVDLACTEAALTLHGPALLDWTVNGRPSRREGQPHSQPQHLAADGAARHLPLRWRRRVGGDRLSRRRRLGALAGDRRGLDGATPPTRRWTAAGEPGCVGRARSRRLDRQPRQVRGAAPAARASVPCSAVQKPGERVDHDPDTEGCGRPSRIRRWARCGWTACRCACLERPGGSRPARRASASTTRRCSAGCSACRPATWRSCARRA